MKMTDLFDILGETIVALHTAPKDSSDFDHAIKKAEYEAKVAKQMVNTADIILRTDKMTGRNDRINKAVGE